MKKNLLLVAALVAVASSSNAEEANTLLAITTDTKYESYEFTYNENNLVEREDFFLKLSGGDEVGYDEYFYNEKNQLIRADTYQYKEDSGDFKKVCYVEYTYDEQGRLATRVNYNNFGGEFMLGGLLDYTYDDAGNLLKVSMYWDLNKTMLFSEEEYTYENGVNVLMTTTVHNFSGASVISKLEKKYDDKNRLIERINYDKDANTSELVKRSINKYQWDDCGIITKGLYTLSGTEVDREEYYYYEAPVSSVIYPIENEMADRNFMLNNGNNALKYYAVYAMDQNSDTLHLYDIYTCNYVTDPDGGQNGVDCVASGATDLRNMSVIRSGEEAVIKGVERGETVRIYDMAGNLVESTIANAGVYNVSNLAKGNYVVVSGSRVLKFSK